MLRGQAKTNYQRDYMRKKRGSNNHSVRPVLDPVRPNVTVLRQLIRSMESKPPEKIVVPLYNPSIHKPGDRVMVKPNYGKKLVETVIPELDDDGNPMT